MLTEPFNSFPEIETNRLLLRRIIETDSKEIFNILSDEKVIENDSFELFKDINDAIDFIKYMNHSYNDKKCIFWGIQEKGNNRLIGFCKYEIEIPNVRSDIGFDLNREYWNRGIMTEAIQRIVQFVYKNTRMNRIETTASISNCGSIRVLEKCGFLKEGILRERCNWHGKIHDMVMMAILRNDYKKANA